MFEHVKLNKESSSKQECSPPMPLSDGHSVVIAAPKRITGSPAHGASLKIPVCGVFMLTQKDFEQKIAQLHAHFSTPAGNQVQSSSDSVSNPVSKLKPVTISLKPMSSFAGDVDSGPPTKGPGGDNENAGGYFAIDAGMSLTPPSTWTSLTLSIEFGGKISNEVTIEHK